MAKIVKNPKFQARYGSRYPWDEWLDGQARLAIRGEDYDVADANFRNMLYRKARDARRKVRASCEKSGEVLFQFYEANGDS